jgi:hypothetical protein
LAQGDPKQSPVPVSAQIRRSFELAPDAISFYSDYVSLSRTGNESVLQFYETLPGVVGQTGRPETATTRLRASIIMSPAQAEKLREVLERTEGDVPESPPE